MWGKLQKYRLWTLKHRWVSFTLSDCHVSYLSLCISLPCPWTFKCLLKVLPTKELGYPVGVKVGVVGKAGLAVCGVWFINRVLPTSWLALKMACGNVWPRKWRWYRGLLPYRKSLGLAQIVYLNQGGELKTFVCKQFSLISFFFFLFLGTNWQWFKNHQLPFRVGWGNHIFMFIHLKHLSKMKLLNKCHFILFWRYAKHMEKIM